MPRFTFTQPVTHRFKPEEEYVSPAPAQECPECPACQCVPFSANNAVLDASSPQSRFRVGGVFHAVSHQIQATAPGYVLGMDYSSSEALVLYVADAAGNILLQDTTGSFQFHVPKAGTYTFELTTIYAGHTATYSWEAACVGFPN